MIKKGLGFLLGVLVLINLAGAVGSFGGFGFSYVNYEDILLFGIVFIFFLAFIFMTIYKVFGNKGIAMVMAVAISGLITFALFSRGFLSGYGADNISDFAIAFGVLLVAGFIVKIAYSSLGKPGSIFVLWFLWLALFFVDPYELFSYGNVADGFAFIHSVLTGIFGLFIVLVVSAIIVFKKKKSALEKLGKKIGL